MAMPMPGSSDPVDDGCSAGDAARAPPPSAIIATLSVSNPPTFAPVVQFCIVALRRVPTTFTAVMTTITRSDTLLAVMGLSETICPR